MTVAARIRLNRLNPLDGEFLFRLATPLSLSFKDRWLCVPTSRSVCPCNRVYANAIWTVTVDSVGVQLSQKADEAGDFALAVFEGLFKELV